MHQKLPNIHVQQQPPSSYHPISRDIRRYMYTSLLHAITPNTPKLLNSQHIY